MVFRVGLRLQRALARAAQVIDAPIETAALFTVYDPRRTAGAFAVALGTGSLGQGGQGTSMAVSDLINWGEREALHHETLPHKLLIATTDVAVYVFTWPPPRQPKPIARWARGSFTAKLIRHRIYGQVDVNITLQNGKTAFVSAKTGLFYRSSLTCAEAITGLSSRPSPPGEAPAGAPPRSEGTHMPRWAPARVAGRRPHRSLPNTA